MRFRIPVEKLLIIAEALFNSKVRYGSCVYLQPVFEKEDLKAKKTHAETEKLQVIQNKMLRMIFGYKMEDRTNMSTLRTNIKMFSINQLTCYHVLLEAYNVINYGSYMCDRKLDIKSQSISFSHSTHTHTQLKFLHKVKSNYKSQSWV